jgi:hypothetical protein
MRTNGNVCGRIRPMILLSLGISLAVAASAQEPRAPADSTGTQGSGNDSCVACHSQLDDTTLSLPARQFLLDIHYANGFTCAACHGGDPTISDTDAMDPAKGFIGVPAAQRIPGLCGKCHSDPAFMRKYNPTLPTDQLSQYRTSRHGQLLAQGDTTVATCAGCHTLHTILPARNPRSSVYALNVASTCGACHSDAAKMKKYGIPTNQVSQYEGSVHWQALSKKGDMSAPTCNDCHGDHAAAPPGVESVANVCGQCHTVEAGRFDQSPHKAAFVSMDLPGCATCHSNHDIEPAVDQFLGLGENTFCGRCHGPDDPGGEAAVKMRGLLDQLKARLSEAHDLLGRAADKGVEVGDAEYRLAAAEDSLVLARVATHEASVAAVTEAVDGGLKVAAHGITAGKEALEEATHRRTGLAVSLIVIVVLIAGLVIRLRRMQREERSRRPGG